ncbi:four-carbon acid sugar kinase family protein [Phreatobacter aquaticus]|uniref:3-oxo-tetronate kinase n=1 Tax=Phreatobacter aquaticus TaxID=2570229 RepID=A0A4D7Q949_9HYPH|nr:3-oxo-tetronate kinase [Phreatobacter aquaticus]QCK84660.1 four-carbon acid sugar kinase family protein [Phreatobacter aquaticus]
MLLGCIADDFTGASDLANTLAKGGMATMQFVGVPQTKAPAECEAGVVALKSRTVAPADAVAQSLAACEWLLAQGAKQILFKYCSTFDSTKEGNIGPVADALIKRLGADVAVVCPVFPATGRTLFNGHLFVNGRLLNESGMQNHPLTPMTDPDIRRWLGYQTKTEVGLVPFATVRAGADAIGKALSAEAAAGRCLAVVDAVGDEDLHAIGAAISGAKLITGGSGIALGLPENFRRQGLLSGRGTSFTQAKGAAAVLSGSCSVQSRAQVKAYTAKHPGLVVMPDDVISGAMTPQIAFDHVIGRIALAPMVYSSADPDDVRAAQERHGKEEVAEAIEGFFGELAIMLADAGVSRLVVGGGETSGAVVTALEVDRFHIGPEIDPGVPALAAQGPRPVRLALKSGNFGALDFYDKALAALGAP